MITTQSLSLSLSAVLLAVTARSDQVRTYFGTSNSRGIYTALFDTATGTLSAPVLAIEIEGPGFLAIHPTKPLLYSTAKGSSGEGAVAAMHIQEDGTLAFINQQSSEGRGPCHVSIDRNGRCLMVANYGSGSVASLKIREDGSLAPATSAHQHEGSGPDPNRQQGPHAHSIYPHPGNALAAAPDLGLDQVVLYTLDADPARLTPSGFVQVPGSGVGPRHLKFSNDGRYAYLLNEMGADVCVFQVGAEPETWTHLAGALTLPEQDDREGMHSSEIRIHPNGRFVYAAVRDTKHRGRDAIAVFSTVPHGGFRHLATVPAEVSIPRNFNIDPTGRWMLVGGKDSKDIAVFSVDETTGIPHFTGRKIPFEGGPICIEFMPDR